MGASSSKVDNNGSDPDREFDYNEEKGTFTKRGQTFSDVVLKGPQVYYEKDLPLSKINEYKTRSDRTVLTAYDTDLLYKLSNIEFNTNYDRMDFENVPIKDLFPGMSPAKLRVNYLMPIAADFIEGIKKGEKIIVERFDGGIIMMGIERIILFIVCVLLFVFISAFILYEADIKRTKVEN